jgi:hypothetical protein
MYSNLALGKRIGIVGLVLLSGLLFGTPARAQNVAPVISGMPSPLAVPGVKYYFKPIASDPNGDRLRFYASGIPGWAKFDNRTGELSGTPSKRHLGKSYRIQIAVTDGRSVASLPRYTLTVVSTAPTAPIAPVAPLPPPNSPPTISGTPATSVVEGELYGFAPTANDPDGNPLTFSITNRPSWATFTASTGLLSGVPPVGSANTYSNVRISVSDGTSSASLAPFSITVTPKPNSPPTIWGVPATSVTSGQTYSFRPSASDPDNDPVTFTVQSLPSWATFDTATGLLRGTPTWQQAGTYPNIVISASDGRASASLAPFTVTVTAANTPPQISGRPADSVTVGQAYSFTPTASDPEGQRLTFSIANRPAWASFDSTTGRLAGTPTASNVGVHSGIVISASDGSLSSSLPAFSIAVASAPTVGSATLRWTAPTTNVDGSPITDLAGYRIVYGQSAGALSQSLTVANSAITSASIENLSSGTWYFAVKAYTSANVESDLSNIAQKTIN